MTEACSSRSGAFDDVRWYTVPGERVPAPVDNDSAQGIWLPDRHAIVLASRSVNDGQLVRHEMLHALLGTTTHPAPSFRRDCGGIVACDGECAAEGGTDPLPEAGSPPINITALQVSGTVAPPVLSLSAGGGWFAILVTVTNPGPGGWVHLQHLPDNEASATFGYVRNADDFLYLYSFIDSVPFLAGETKRFAIDRAGGAAALVVGSYQLWPFFNVDTGASIAVSVSP